MTTAKKQTAFNRALTPSAELAAVIGAAPQPRTEVVKLMWEYIKANNLQTKTENGKPGEGGKFIVADAKLLPVFRNTKSTSKSGTVTDFTKMKEGQTVNMMQIAAVVGANVDQSDLARLD